jgi:lysophospholipase L1-like esterase
LRPRSDGLTWACSDLADDGTHPSSTGRQKVAQLLLDFVRTDPTAREWYLR